MLPTISVFSRLTRAASRNRTGSDRRVSSFTERLAIGLGCGDWTVTR